MTQNHQNKGIFKILLLFVIPLLFQVVTSAAQARMVRGPSECSSETSHSYTLQGHALSNKGQYDRALEAFQKAVREEPTCAATYSNLGTAYFELGRNQEAISNYQLALRFKPSWAWIVFSNMARSFVALGLFDKAGMAFEEALKLQPKESQLYSGRADLNFMLDKTDAALSDLDTVQKLKGLGDEGSRYSVLIKYFVLRRANRPEDANRLLDEVLEKAKKTKWPHPIYQYLRGRITEKELFAMAADRDQMTDARAYVGLNQLNDGNMAAAVEHFGWVKENGRREVREYQLSLWGLQNAMKAPK